MKGRPKLPTTKHKEACREAAQRRLNGELNRPTQQEIYGPVPPTPDNPRGLGLAALERMKREGWEDNNPA